MNGKTLERLKYFEGKVCSIVTSSMNRSFDEKISREHFVVRVEDVNPDGVWGSHPYNPEMQSYFAMPHIISVHQEIELNPENPEHAQLIREYEERTGQKAAPDIMGQPKEMPPEKSGGMEPAFVDIKNLEQMAAQIKNSFDSLRQ